MDILLVCFGILCISMSLSAKPVTPRVIAFLILGIFSLLTGLIF